MHDSLGISDEIQRAVLEALLRQVEVLAVPGRLLAQRVSVASPVCAARITSSECKRTSGGTRDARFTMIPQLTSWLLPRFQTKGRSFPGRVRASGPWPCIALIRLLEYKSYSAYSPTLRRRTARPRRRGSRADCLPRCRRANRVAPCRVFTGGRPTCVRQRHTRCADARKAANRGATAAQAQVLAGRLAETFLGCPKVSKVRRGGPKTLFIPRQKRRIPADMRDRLDCVA
eukprot:COSAG04_NODE_1528_length_6453_cov_6.160529_9_plen_230_part_00